jgi:hypothetical protein
MITREDLETRRIWVEPIDGGEWREVSYQDRHFLLCAINMTEEDIERVVQNDFPFVLVAAIEGEAAAVQLFKDTFPTSDTAVFPAVIREDGKFDMKYECDEECSKGVCKKRLAGRHGVGDMDLAYNMLIDALNS